MSTGNNMKRASKAKIAVLLAAGAVLFFYLWGYLGQRGTRIAGYKYGSGAVAGDRSYEGLEEFGEWLKKDFAGEQKLLLLIRNSLANNRPLNKLPELNIDMSAPFAWAAVTLFERGNVPIRWIAKRNTPVETINRITEKLREHGRFGDFSISDANKCRIMLEVLTGESSLDIEHLNTTRFDSNRFEPGITGFKLRYNGGTYYYMPTDAVVKSHLSIKQALNNISKKIGVAKQTDSISERIRIMKRLPIQWSIIKSVAFVTYGDRTIPLYRGYPVPVEFSKDRMAQMVSRSVNWLYSNMSGDGRFLYYYDGVADSIIDHAHPNRTEQNNYYNILRHCGGVIALLRAYELTADDKYIPAAQKALNFLLKNVREHSYKNRKAYYVFYNKKAKLGGTGVALIALLQYRQITGDTKFDDYIFGMADHLLSRITDDGEMLGYYIHPQYNDGKPIISPTPKQKRLLFSFYYPGEALMALAMFERQMNLTDRLREEVTAASKRALDFLVKIRPVKYADMFRPLPSDSWLMQAIEQWASNEEFQKKEYLDFVFNDAREMISHTYNEQNSPYYDYPGMFYYNYGDHAYPDGSRAEGLIAAYYLAERMGESKLAAYILENCKTVAESLMYTYNSPESTYMHRYPEKSIGSFRFKLTRQWMRVDTVQHAACFYARLLFALYEMEQ